MRLAFTLHALVLAGYGLTLLVIPETFLGLYGAGVSPGAEVAIRFFGGVVLGNGFLSWSLREMPVSDTIRVVLLVFAFDWLVTAVVGVLGQLSAAMNPLGWSTVALAAVWMVVFSYLRFGRRMAG
jgi:hypothetical protein